MSREIISLADILSIEEMRALCDLSPEAVIKKFLEDPAIKKMEYRKEENKFYITFSDGEIAQFRFFCASRET